MAEKKNTVLPTSKEENEKLLASNPATRAARNEAVVKKAGKEGTTADLAPKTVKKSWGQKVVDNVKDFGNQAKEGWKELTQKDTPEMAQVRKEQREKEAEILKRKGDKIKEGLAIEAGALGAIALPGAKAKVAAGLLGLGANRALNAQHEKENKEWDEKNGPLIRNKEESEATAPKDETIGTAPIHNNEIKSNVDVKANEAIDAGDKAYDNYISKVAKQQGLGKYVNEDGSIDYDRLQKSKIGFQILNALIGGIGGAAAGAAFKDAPDMSHSMLAQEVDKRNRVVEEAQKSAEQEKQNAIDISTFTAKLGLQGEQAVRAQKEMARFMSNLSYNDQVRMMQYMKGMDIKDALKLGFAQNPYGAMSAAFSGLGSLGGGIAGALGSDEACKKFANRRVFK